MAVAVVLFLLLVLCAFAFAFGAVRLFLRGSSWEPYTIEATFLAGPLFVVLVLSAGGYYTPVSVSPLAAWLLFLGGVALSVGVVIADWRALRILLRDNALRLFVILMPAILAAGVLLVYLPGDRENQFSFLGNAEYLNYAEMAAVLTGHYKPTPDMPVAAFVEPHRLVRNGQDLVTAVTAQLSHRHPVQVVLPLSVFYRLQYAVALGLILFGLVDRRRWWVVLAVLVLDACLLVEIFSFSASFMSSNCSLPLYVVYLGMLNGRGRIGVREVVLFVMLNVYFLLTYPEFLGVVKCFEVVQLALWVVLRRADRWKPLLVANLSVCLLHPVAVAYKLRYTFALRNQLTGWNAFGDPVSDPFTYLASCVGIRDPHLLADPLGLPGWLSVTVTVVVLAAVAAGLCVLLWKHRLGWAVVAWTIAVLLLHTNPFISHINFYQAVKFTTQTVFLLPLALLALCNVRLRLVRLTGLAIVLLWGVTAAFALTRAVPAAARQGVVYDYPKIRDVLKFQRGENREVAVLASPPDLWVCKLAASESGLAVKPLFPEQKVWLDRGGVPPAEKVDRVGDGLVFKGLILTDADTLAKGRYLGGNHCFDLRPERILGLVKGLILCQGRVLHSSRAEFGAGWWVSTEHQPTPSFFVRGRRLVLRGEAPPCLAMPCRFKCRIPGIDWECEETLPAWGRFETIIDLPPDAVGRCISLTFDPSQTFRPKDIDPRSLDGRALSFLLHSIESTDVLPGAGKPH
jgi:hypothetical protein